VGGHERDTQRRGLLKPDALRHSDRLPGGDDHTLRGCLRRPLAGGVVDPHGLSEARILDVRPDRVDHARAVLARDLHRERQNISEEPSPSPPIRGIDRRKRQPHPHLPTPRLGLGQIAKLQDLTGRTHAVIDGCAHPQTSSLAGTPTAHAVLDPPDSDPTRVALITHASHGSRRLRVRRPCFRAPTRLAPWRVRTTSPKGEMAAWCARLNTEVPHPAGHVDAKTRRPRPFFHRTCHGAALASEQRLLTDRSARPVPAARGQRHAHKHPSAFLILCRKRIPQRGRSTPHRGCTSSSPPRSRRSDRPCDPAR
jgi:hypothetical protein